MIGFIFKKADFSVTAHVFFDFLVRTFCEFFSLKTINKIKITNLEILKNFLKRFFRCSVGERCHCALMTLR